MKPPIYVLCVVTQMNRGGMESRIMDIYRNIDRSRIQFHFYTCRLLPGYYDEEIKELGGVIYYNKPLEIKKIFFIARIFSEFFNNHNQYKIVHAHMNQWCGLILKGAKKANVPVRIAHSRTALNKLSTKNIIKNIIKLPTNKYATHKLAVSKKAGQWLYGKKHMHSVSVFPNAIDNETYSYNSSKREDKREELNLEDAFTIIHVGNLKIEKNHEFLFDIFKGLKNTDANTRLILVGQGHLDGKLQNLARNLGIYEDVLFLGLRDDVPDLLQAGDVFVFPSLYEGLPGAVLEAQASGLPCIISDVITDEVRISPLVEQISLKQDKGVWIESIIKTRNITRENTEYYFKKSGFNIHLLVNDLSEFYEENYDNVVMKDKI